MPKHHRTELRFRDAIAFDMCERSFVAIGGKTRWGRVALYSIPPQVAVRLCSNGFGCTRSPAHRGGNLDNEQLFINSRAPQINWRISS
jgi:hypothetical protein